MLYCGKLEAARPNLTLPISLSQFLLTNEPLIEYVINLNNIFTDHYMHVENECEGTLAEMVLLSLIWALDGLFWDL